MKVHILGDAGVGKTSLINFLQEQKFEPHYEQTIKERYYEIYHNLLKYEIWDTPLEEKYDVDYSF